MSVVVALSHEGVIYFGADSLASSDADAELRKDPKIYVRGPYLIGAVGSPRISQVLRFDTPLPVRKPGLDSFGFMVAHFVKNFRKTAKSNDCSPVDGDEFLVGFESRIFHIDSTYAVAEVTSSFNAIGSGGIAARGALHQQQALIVRGVSIKPRDRVIDALKISEALSSGVRRPFTILEQKVQPS